MTYHLNLTNESLPGIFWGETPPRCQQSINLELLWVFFCYLLRDHLPKIGHRKAQTEIEKDRLLMTSCGHLNPVGRLDFSIV